MLFAIGIRSANKIFIYILFAWFAGEYLHLRHNRYLRYSCQKHSKPEGLYYAFGENAVCAAKKSTPATCLANHSAQDEYHAHQYKPKIKEEAVIAGFCCTFHGSRF